MYNITKMPLSYPYAYAQEPAKVNWWIVILIFTGILTIIVLVTVFFIIPDYVRGYFNDKVQERINKISENAVSPNCNSDIYNCSNFTIQAEAQDVFDWCVRQGKGDVHQLDADGNGEACDSLA